jgi:hypothetical protein
MLTHPHIDQECIRAVRGGKSLPRYVLGVRSASGSDEGTGVYLLRVNYWQGIFDLEIVPREDCEFVHGASRNARLIDHPSHPIR